MLALFPFSIIIDSVDKDMTVPWNLGDDMFKRIAGSFVFFSFFGVLRIKPRNSYMLGNCETPPPTCDTQPALSSNILFIFEQKWKSKEMQLTNRTSRAAEADLKRRPNQNMSSKLQQITFNCKNCNIKISP